MSALFTVPSLAWLEYTPGDFVGDGAHTIAVLFNPNGTITGMAEWRNSGLLQNSLLLYNSHLFGNGDTSSGFGTYSSGWQVFAMTKAAGSSLYRMHSWTYDSSGAGSMVHGSASGAAPHSDFAAADAIRIGAWNSGANPADGQIAVAAMWNRALSDTELDTLVSANLSDWAALTPDFGVELSGWDGTTGDTVWAGTSTFVSETGIVGTAGNPTGFNFTIDLNEPPTVYGGPNRSAIVGQTVSLTATANDVDGTIASVDWSQIVGPAVALGGSGANRTFTPTIAGTYIFGVTATDNDGATSDVDLVTVIVVAALDNPSSTVKPWGPWERAVLELFVAGYDAMPDDRTQALARVGGNFDYDDSIPWYIRIDKVFSQSTRLEGAFTVDVEVFAPADGNDAESVSNDLEALLLGYPHVVRVDDETFIFDRVYQNAGPDDLPWEDEAVTRLGATYVITARRR